MNLAYCECGWATEKVDGDPWRSSRNIRQHRKSKKHARAMETKDRLCTICHLERVDPVRGSATECEGCHKAQRDRESAFDLGPGQWVRQGTTRVWVPDPTPIRAPSPHRKAAA